MIIDVHAHYCPPELWKAIAEGRFGEQVAAGRAEDGSVWWQGDGVRAQGPAALADIRQRLVWMNDHGIDVQILAAWPPALVLAATDVDRLRRYHSEWNRALARAVDAFPERLQFLAAVPLAGSPQALEVLDEAVNRLGAVGVLLPVAADGIDRLADPSLDPLWGAVSDLAIPVVLQPIPPRPPAWTGDPRWALPAVVAAAADTLWSSGMLQRYPLVDVVLTCGGGHWPWQAPADAAGRFYYDTVAPCGPAPLLQRAGEGRLLFGSGYPTAAPPAPDVPALAAAVGTEAAERIAEQTPLTVFARL